MRRNRKLFAKQKGPAPETIGWASLLLPLAGLAAAVLIATRIDTVQSEWFGLEKVTYGAAAFAVCSLVGLLLGIYANARRFSLPGLVSILSGALAIGMLAFVATQ